MAALSSGWIDTGITWTQVLSCDLELRAWADTNNRALLSPVLAIAVWDNVGLQFGTLGQGAALGCGSPESYATVESILYDGSTAITLNSAGGSCTGGGDGYANWLPAIGLVKTFGPLRLGATWESGYLKYAWFTDASTTLTYAVDGTTYRTYTYSNPPALTQYDWYYGSTPFSKTILGQGTQLQIGSWFLPGDVPADAMRLTNFVADGLSITPPFTCSFPQTHNGGATAGVFNTGPRLGSSVRYTLDVDCEDADGTAEAADTSLGVACPNTQTARVDVFDQLGDTSAYSPTLGGYLIATPTLANPWLAAQTVTPYTADQSFQWQGNRPLDPTQTSPTTWSIGTIDLAASTNVLYSTNAWTVDTGSIAVGGTSTAPIFTVTSGPGIVKRVLKEHWRNWNAPADPLYQAGDQYTATKRNAYSTGATTPDTWGWGTYAYLDIDLTPGAAGDLAIEVTWVVRRSGNDTIVKNYTATWGAGRSTQTIDLLFPDEIGRPFFGERVDQVRIVGLQVGTYTLHSLTLRPSEQAYLKLGGKTWINDDGTTAAAGCVLSVDGSFPTSQWSSDTVNTLSLFRDADADGFIDFRFDQQNGKFLVNGLTQDTLGRAVGMGVSDLQAFMTELNKMEGVTATYSSAAIDAAFTDADGNTIAPTRAVDWLVPTMPHVRVTAGTPYTAYAWLVPSTIIVPAGTTAGQMVLFLRNHLGAVLDALATDVNYDRVGAGGTVNARRYTAVSLGSSDPLLATTTTDASGMVTLPIRTGTVSGSHFNAYLTSS